MAMLVYIMPCRHDVHEMIKVEFCSNVFKFFFQIIQNEIIKKAKRTV